MKAAIYYGPGDIRIEEIGRPKPGDEGIVVKVRAAGICGTDLHYYRQAWRSLTALVLGHENTGDVVEVGANVKDVKVGDRVWTEAFLPCFECEWCKRKDYYKCLSPKGFGGIRGLNGGFAEYLWVPVVLLNRNVFKLTEAMSYQDGALLEPIAVGVRTMNNAEPKTDDVVVVLGVGMVGLGVVAKLKALGVSRVIVSDVSEKRLQAAKELGANLIVNPTEEDIVKRVMEETSGRGADIVVEAAGKPVTLRQSIDMVRRGGKIMVVANFVEPFEFNPDSFRVKNVRIISCVGNDFQAGFDIVKAGGVKDKQLVSHVFPLDRIKEAFETAMNTKESIKVMIEP